MSETHRPGWDKPLDESFYAPDDEEKAFMKTTTGIQDDDELKRHIIAAQTKAFSVCFSVCVLIHTFPCRHSAMLELCLTKWPTRSCIGIPAFECSNS